MVILESKLATGTLILNIILNLILIPPELYGIGLYGMGGEGAAIATLVSSMIAIALRRYYTKKLFKISSYTGSVSIISGLISGGLIYYCSYEWELNHFAYLPFQFLSLALIYFLTMYIFNQINKTDIKFLVDTINFRSMKSYKSSELKEGYKK